MVGERGHLHQAITGDAKTLYVPEESYKFHGTRFSHSNLLTPPKRNCAGQSQDASGRNQRSWRKPEPPQWNRSAGWVHPPPPEPPAADLLWVPCPHKKQ